MLKKHQRHPTTPKKHQRHSKNINMTPKNHQRFHVPSSTTNCHQLRRPMKPRKTPSAQQWAPGLSPAAAAVAGQQGLQMQRVWSPWYVILFYFYFMLQYYCSVVIVLQFKIKKKHTLIPGYHTHIRTRKQTWEYPYPYLMGRGTDGYG